MRCRIPTRSCLPVVLAASCGLIAPLPAQQLALARNDNVTYSNLAVG